MKEKKPSVANKLSTVLHKEQVAGTSSVAVVFQQYFLFFQNKPIPPINQKTHPENRKTKAQFPFTDENGKACKLHVTLPFFIRNLMHIHFMAKMLAIKKKEKSFHGNICSE